MKSIFTSLLFIVTTMCFCQTNAVHKNYIHLFSDSIIYGSHLSFESGFMVETHLNMDGQKYKLDDVKFYDDGFGLKGNVMRATYGKSLFAHIILEGKINLYKTSQKTFHHQPYTVLSAFIDLNRKELKKSYFNKGISELKKTTFKNLVSEIGDNPNCTNAIQKYQRINKTSKTVNTVVGGLIASAIVFITYDPSRRHLQPYVIPSLLSVSIPAIIYRYMMRNKKEQLITELINTYNRK
jgi:hypothetical protein